MSVATLEFYLADVGRYDLAVARDLPALGYPIHARSSVAEHLDPVPLCWLAEGEQRGATVAEWEISFDHEALPSYAVVDHGAHVTCSDCKEWIHA